MNPYDCVKGACAQARGAYFDFCNKVDLFAIVLAQIGHFWRFLGHLEGDLIPKRGQIFVGSWASLTEPKNYINQAY
jgi:hypothetical protein